MNGDSLTGTGRAGRRLDLSHRRHLRCEVVGRVGVVRGQVDVPARKRVGLQVDSVAEAGGRADAARRRSAEDDGRRVARHEGPGGEVHPEVAALELRALAGRTASGRSAPSRPVGRAALWGTGRRAQRLRTRPGTSLRRGRARPCPATAAEACLRRARLSTGLRARIFATRVRSRIRGVVEAATAASTVRACAYGCGSPPLKLGTKR